MADGDLLELRVHGVNNTPPVSMLDAIQQEYGDSLVGVYRERPTSGVVKALSWGGLSRLSPFPRIPFAKWLAAVQSAGWIFVIPFGLTNVAYWSRRLTLPGESYKTVRITAGLTRLFSLGLTLLLVSSVCSVSLDMAESRIQTLLDTGSLPKWLAVLHHTDIGDRMAALSLAPVLAIMLLWILATRTRVVYDKGRELPRSAADKTQKWKFGTANFWDNADLSAHNAGVHMAAGLALSLLWTGQFWAGEHTGFGTGVISLSIAILAACTALTLTSPMATQENAVGKPKRLLTRTLVAVAGATFVVQSAALVGWHSPTVEPNRLKLFSLVPGAIVFVLLAIAVSALGWRTHRRLAYVVAAVSIAIGVGALLAERRHWVGPTAVVVVDRIVIVTLLLISAAWLCWLRWRQRDRPAEAWRGAAPGVLMILALFAAVLLSTVFVVVSAALLGGGPIKVSDTQYMTAPPIYLSFATMLIPTITAIVLVLAVAWLAVVWRCRTPTEPTLDATTQPDSNDMDCLAELFDKSHNAGKGESLYRRRCHIRRVASLLQRAEPLAACLAVISAAAVIGGVIFALLLDDGIVDQDATSFHWLQKFGVGAALLVGTIIVGHGVSQGRPLGIVWDLICFLPRAAHPFGPPCYAQRAVPELHTYCRAWLDSPPTGEDESKPRRLILSAHSLGGVLAVAVVLLLSDKYRDRIALLTYGCQLRAYFSRIFPELLGPQILGVMASSPARLLRCPTFPPDPPPGPDEGGFPASVRQILSEAATSRWVNLWRPTDYLGFPAYSRAPRNPVDRPADEVTAERVDEGRIVKVGTDTDLRTLTGPVNMATSLEFAPTWIVRVDTHSDYFRTRQYPVAVEDLAELLSHSTTPRGKGPPGVS